MKILIICTGNTCRSPMAEGIVKDIIEKKGLSSQISVESMGFGAYEGQSPTRNAVEVMKEIGIDISKHKSKRVMLQDLVKADIYYVMTPSHKHIICDAMPELEDRIRILDVCDPFSGNMDIYRESRDKIKAFFEKEFEEMDYTSK